MHQVLYPLTGLERLSFRDTDLSGPLPCSLLQGKDDLKVLDVSDSPASGELPGCVLAVREVEGGGWSVGLCAALGFGFVF